MSFTDQLKITELLIISLSKDKEPIRDRISDVKHENYTDDSNHLLLWDFPKDTRIHKCTADWEASGVDAVAREVIFKVIYLFFMNPTLLDTTQCYIFKIIINNSFKTLRKYI